MNILSPINSMAMISEQSNGAFHQNQGIYKKIYLLLFWPRDILIRLVQYLQIYEWMSFIQLIRYERPFDSDELMNGLRGSNVKKRGKFNDQEILLRKILCPLVMIHLCTSFYFD